MYELDAHATATDVGWDVRTIHTEGCGEIGIRCRVALAVGMIDRDVINFTDKRADGKADVCRAIPRE
jgi:hypothetical protein